MPLLSLNMAVPFSQNRDSQVYIFSSTELVQSQSVNNKYIIFKSLELALSLCALFVFFYTVESSATTSEDLLICTAFGALTFYALSFIILSINIKQQCLHLIIINIITILTLFLIGGKSMSIWLDINVFLISLQTKDSEVQIWKLIYSILTLINGFLYMVETLFISYENRNLIRNS